MAFHLVGDLDSALDSYKKVVSLLPEHKDALFGQACLSALSDPVKGKALLDELLVKFPAHLPGLLNRAAVACAAGRYADAAADCEAALIDSCVTNALCWPRVTPTAAHRLTRVTFDAHR